MESASLQRSHAFVLDLSSEAAWFQAIIGCYWSHWSDAHLTYILWPLRSFSTSFLSASTTASLHDAPNTATNTCGNSDFSSSHRRPALSLCRPSSFVFPFLCLKRKRALTSRKRGGTCREDHWLHTQTTKEDKAWQERRAVKGNTERIRQSASTNQFRPPPCLFKASKISTARRARDIRETDTAINSAWKWPARQSWQNQWNKIATSQYGAKCT